MFSWRSQKQFVVFLIVISPIVVVAFFIIKGLIPVATCFDNKQNQSEIGLDCGGSCVSCEFKYPKAITVFSSRAVLVSENFYDLAAEIENPNEFLSSVRVEYEFKLYDRFGLVTTRTGTTFLYAQERTLVIEPGIPTTRSAERAEFRIISVDWQEKRDLAPTIIAEQRVYSVVEVGGKKQSVVDITLMNKSLYDFAKVEMQVAVLDKQKNLLGVNKILMEDFLSQSRQEVRSIWPQEFIAEISVINVQARANIFDPHVILKLQ
jgi:hypothetical protein